MKQQFKVVHVELKEPYRDKRHYYYGSKAAIYEELPEEVIGIKKESLWNVDLEEEDYENRLCIIRSGVLRRKQTNRGAKSKYQENMDSEAKKEADKLFNEIKKSVGL